MDTTTRSTAGGEGSRSRPASGPPSGRTRPAGRRDQRRPPSGPRTVPRAVPQAVPRPVRRPGGPHDWFAERLLAVLSGQRPVHSLLGLTVGEAYEQLVTLAPTGPLRERLRPVLRHCGRFHPGPGVIEAFARITTGDRVSAMAFRLEQGSDLRWRCAAVEVGAPRP
ncbi:MULTISPECIES: Rv3235 family protein [unclassified Streptomyces]|uniref:Rv3235 family protein n=1 Tax=unclassified Streptomyces TaxID=2593676 RepID=UPI00364BABFA